MTQSGSSFYETLGRASDAPPDISKTNYLQTTPDLTEAVNKNIDDISKSWDEHFNRMIENFNVMHERGNIPQQLVAFLGDKTNQKGAKALKEYYEWQKKYNKISGELDAAFKSAAKAYGIDSKQYADVKKYAFINEPDVEAEHKLEKENEAIHIESDNAGYELVAENNSEATDAAGKFFNGLNNQYASEGQKIEDMEDILNVMPRFMKLAEAGLKVPIPGRFDEEGRQVFQTYDEQVSLADKKIVRNILQGYFAKEFEGIVQGRTGLYKRKFISKIIEQNQITEKEELDAHTNALLSDITERTGRELKKQLSENPGYAITWMKRMLNHPEVLDNGNISHRLVRRKLVDLIVEAIGEESLDGNDLYGEGKLETLMVDTFASGTQQFSKFWKKDWERIVNAVNAKNIEKYNEINSAKTANEAAQIRAKVGELESKEDVITKADLDQVISDLRYELGYDATDALPSHWQPLLNYRYQGSKDDKTIADEIKHRKEVLNETIDLKDLVGIIDPDLKKSLVEKYVTSPGGLRKGGSGNDPGTSTHRDNWITTIVNQYTDETDINTAKTQKWRNNYDQAKRHYNAIFNQSKENNMSDWDAAVTAEKSVNAMLFGPNSKIQVNIGTAEKPIIIERGIWDEKGITTFDIQGQRDLVNTVKAINNNKSLINQKEPYKGEEKPLEEGLKYLKASQKGERGATFPEYYRNLGAALWLDPHQLLRDRLVANGLVNSGEFKFAYEGIPGEALLVKHTPSRVMRALSLQGGDPDEMIKMSYLAYTEKEGFNYLRHENNQVFNLEEVTGKPIDEITMGDISDLALQDYSGFGIFDLSGMAIQELLTEANVPYDMPFNEAGQKFLYLARIRQKAQRANQNSGVLTDYRRLVYINENLHEEFRQIAPDLPEWLDPNTLSPAGAKELIRLLSEQ